MGLDRGDVGARPGSDTPMQATAAPDIAGAKNSRRTSFEPNRASAGSPYRSVPDRHRHPATMDGADVLPPHQRKTGSRAPGRRYSAGL